MAAGIRQQEQAGGRGDGESAKRDQPVACDADECVGRARAAGDGAHHARAVAHDQARQKGVDESRLQISAQGFAKRQRRRGEARDQHPSQGAENDLRQQQDGGEQRRGQADLAQAVSDLLQVHEMKRDREQRRAATATVSASSIARRRRDRAPGSRAVCVSVSMRIQASDPAMALLEHGTAVPSAGRCVRADWNNGHPAPSSLFKSFDDSLER